VKEIVMLESKAKFHLAIAFVCAIISFPILIVLLGNASVLTFIVPMSVVLLGFFLLGARARRIAKVEFDENMCRFTTLTGAKVEFSGEELRANSGVTWNGFNVKYGQSWLACYCDSLPVTANTEEFLRIIGRPKLDRFERQWAFLFPAILSCIPLIMLGFACYYSTTEYYKGAFRFEVLVLLTAILVTITYGNAVRANKLFMRAPTARFIFGN
jgi:hypothetical protein